MNVAPPDKRLSSAAMVETLKTLRLTHLTLVGVSAAVILMSTSKVLDFSGALRELDTFRSMLIDRIDEYYAICEREATRSQAGERELSRFREAFERVIQEQGQSIELADDFAVQYFGYCDGPNRESTLEDYEVVLTKGQRIYAPDFEDEAFRQALEQLEERRAPSGAKISSLSIALNVGSPDPLAHPRLFHVSQDVFEMKKRNYWFGVSLSSGRGHYGFSCGSECTGGSSGAGIIPIGIEWLAGAETPLIAPSADGPIVFPKLKQFWPLVRPMGVDDAYAYLEEARQGAEREVSLLGLQISADVAVWAAPLVALLVLCYLWVNLQHARSLQSNEAEALNKFPWVALFPDPLSRSLTLLSVLILPAGASALLLALRGPKPVSASPVAIASIVLVALCAVAGIFSCVQIARVRPPRDDNARGRRPWKEWLKGLAKKKKPGKR